MIATHHRRVGLWVLFSLFVIRVSGQIVVGLSEPRWLPPWDQWQSGVLPYPTLLTAQVAICVWMLLLCRHNTGTRSSFTLRSEKLRRGLRLFAAVYATAMGIRYVLTQALTSVPWWHDTIPVAFHLVLASYIGLLASARTDRCLRQGARR